MSILTSVELVSQTKLHVSVYLFVSLYLCSTIDWIFFFRGFGYGPFRHCWGGHKHKKLTSVTNPREAGILGSYIPHFFENGLTFYQEFFVKLFLVSLRYKKSQRGTLCWESFWVICGLILLYVPISLEKRSIFFQEILYRCSWYTLTVTTLFFFFCVMSTCNPFWCTFLYFLRIVQYLLMKFCIDVCSTNLMVTALKLFIHILYFSADGHFWVILD